MPARAQAPDTTAAEAVRTPRGALWRAAALPGWGQRYNRQTWKIPVVYAGLAGLGAGALALNADYLRYRHAFLYKRNQELVEQGQIDENPWPQYEDEYRALIDAIADGADVSGATLRTRRDALRRNRDLFYFGIGLWYGLAVLDAYVSAHLLDFDVGEDLTLRLAPAPTGFTATLRLGLGR